MAEFMSSVLGAERIEVDGVEADLFLLPDGGTFAIASPHSMGDTERSLGFLVDDLDVAVADLRSQGVDTDGIASNTLYRYVHFTAPDGNVYELVEQASDGGAQLH